MRHKCLFCWMLRRQFRKTWPEALEDIGDSGPTMSVAQSLTRKQLTSFSEFSTSQGGVTPNQYFPVDFHGLRTRRHPGYSLCGLDRLPGASRLAAGVECPGSFRLDIGQPQRPLFARLLLLASLPAGHRIERVDKNRQTATRHESEASAADSPPSGRLPARAAMVAIPSSFGCDRAAQGRT